MKTKTKIAIPVILFELLLTAVATWFAEKPEWSPTPDGWPPLYYINFCAP